MRLSFSDQELNDLLKAWAAISFAFAIASGALRTGLLMNFVVAAITVGTAFILHELAHKFTAQRFGCWAEFRAFNLGLILAVLMSFSGFIFAAPGAVMILGMVTAEENGKIAAAGPLTNLILVAIFILLSFLAGIFLSGSSSGLLRVLLDYGLRVNAWLALFNLLPFWQLDGAKVLAWSSRVWVLLTLTAAVLVFRPF